MPTQRDKKTRILFTKWYLLAYLCVRWARLYIATRTRNSWRQQQNHSFLFHSFLPWKKKKLEITFEFHYKCDENFFVLIFFTNLNYNHFWDRKKKQNENFSSLIYILEKQNKKVTRYLVFFLLLPIISSVHWFIYLTIYGAFKIKLLIVNYSEEMY